MPKTIGLSEEHVPSGVPSGEELFENCNVSRDGRGVGRSVMIRKAHRSENCGSADVRTVRTPGGGFRMGIGIVLGISLLAPTISLSCPIPVYRYALEFWEASPYRVEVYHRGRLSVADQRVVGHLSQARGGRLKANVETRSIDVEGDVDEMTLRRFEELSPPRVPWMVVRYPRVSGMNDVLWSGPLSRVNADRVLDSPARTRIAEMLADDATAVWVLLESGDRAKDRAAAALLERELKRLERTLKLPDLELWMSDIDRIPVERLPAVRFGSIRVSRDDPREARLVEMLLNSEADLAGFGAEPIVFPVYGRGIALWAIVGSGINEWTLAEAAEFLTGPCSCQVKSLNPGVDLLIAHDWEAKVNRVADLSVATPAVGMAEFADRGEEARRRLEAATRERLGGRSGRTEAVDPDRVVYLDLFGDGGRESQAAEPVGSGAETGTLEAKPDATEEAEAATVPLRPAPVDPGSASTLEPEASGPRVYLPLAAGFFGAVLLIALGGAILYRRAGKRV